MDSPATTEDLKAPLRDGSIRYLPALTQRKWSCNQSFSCSIQNYSDLRDYTYYIVTREILGKERTFKVYRTKKHHHFYMYCEVTEIMDFQLMYDGTNQYWAAEATQTEYGCMVKVTNENVLDPGNKYLHQRNYLVFNFNYMFSPVAYRVPWQYHGNRKRRDEDLFARDFSKLYDTRNETADLVIEVRGQSFPLHRIVFAARTKFFDKNVDMRKENSFSIRSEPAIMDTVVRYMYLGTLHEMGLEDIMKVLELANIFLMRSLILTAANFLTGLVKYDNVPKILKLANKLQMTQLSKGNKDFVPKTEEGAKGKERSRCFSSKNLQQARRRQ